MPRAHNGADLKFRAISDQTRLRILHLLRAGEICVNDLVEIIDVPQPTASRHLAYLRKAALVATRPKGLWIYYRLAPSRTRFHAKLLGCLSDIPRSGTDVRRRTKLKASGGCCPR